MLVRIWRGAQVESQHRGAWVLADADGTALDGAGDWEWPVYARSSIKALQALPLLEVGAAERVGWTQEELALTLASHDAEPCHTEVVLGALRRLGLGVEHLRCGPQPPGDARTRAALEARGERPSALHNNCSGKHAGFLALALHLGVPLERYLEPDSAGQRLVRAAVSDMCGVPEREIAVAVDGCSAPTLRLPLLGLATASARLGDPSGLSPQRADACRRIQRAVAAHPTLIGGSQRRLCSDLARASGGALLPKIGAEGVYVIGVVGAGRGLAIKIDDGGKRALYAAVLRLLARFRLLPEAALAALAAEYAGDPIRNWAGLAVGRTEVLA